MALTQVPDLVRDSQLPVRFYKKITYHDRGGREEKWTQQRPLGVGGFGKVFLEECNSHGNSGRCELRAVKIIPRESSLGPIDYNNELLAIAKFSQPKFNNYFIRSLGWYQNDENVSIAMEYMEHGDLENYLTQPLPENETQRIIRQLLHGLRYMHEDGFTHRDLKPKNIFVVTKGPDWWVKIGDFGLSKRVHESTALRTFVGTPGYMALEVYQTARKSKGEKNPAYTLAADMWSLGILVWRILIGKRPCSGDIEQLAAITSTKFPGGAMSPSGLSKQAYLFLKGLLKVDPCHRLTARDGLQHAWLKKCTRQTLEPSSRGTQNASTDLPSSLPASSLGELSEASGRVSNLDETVSEPILPTKEILGQAFKLPSKATRPNLAEPQRLSLSPSPVGFPKASRRLGDLHGTISNSALAIEASTGQTPEPSTKVIRDTISEPLWSPPGLSSSMPVYGYFYSAGCCYLDNKNHATAELTFKKFLKMHTDEIRPRSKGGKVAFDIYTSMALYKLGQCVLAQGRYNEAEGFFLDAAKQRQELLGPDDEHILELIRRHVLPRLDQDEVFEAEENFRQAITGKGKVFGREYGGVLMYVFQFGTFLEHKREYSDAERIFSEVVRVREKKLGPSHEDTLESIDRLAHTLYIQEKYDQAERRYRQLTERQTETLDIENPFALDPLYMLGCSLRQLGKYDGAEEILRKVMGAQEQELGSSHKNTLNSMNELAMTQYLQGKCDTAFLTFNRLTELQAETLGAKKRKTLVSAHWAGRCLYYQGNHAEAIKVFDRVHAAQRETLGGDDDDTKESHHWLRKSMRKGAKGAFTNIVGSLF